jgi:hypothetical protein
VKDIRTGRFAMRVIEVRERYMTILGSQIAVASEPPDEIAVPRELAEDPVAECMRGSHA